jgi:hypothetical protein
MNEEKILNDVRCNKNIIKINWSRENCVNGLIANNDGRMYSRIRWSKERDVTRIKHCVIRRPGVSDPLHK